MYARKRMELNPRLYNLLALVPFAAQNSWWCEISCFTSSGTYMDLYNIISCWSFAQDATLSIHRDRSEVILHHSESEDLSHDENVSIWGLCVTVIEFLTFHLSQGGKHSFSLLSSTFGCWGYIAPNETVVSEWDKIWKEVSVVQFEVLSRTLFRTTEGSYEIFYSG
jgi:hypothetical protein